MEEAEIKYILGSYAILYVLYPEKKEERLKIAKKIDELKKQGLIKDEDVKRAIRFVAKLKEKEQSNLFQR